MKSTLKLIVLSLAILQSCSKPSENPEMSSSSLPQTALQSKNLAIAASAPYSITLTASGNIQQALDSCEAHGGGSVYLHSGTYYVSTSILIPDHCTLRGITTDPTEAVIILRAGFDCPVIKNKYTPFHYVNVVHLDIRGGLTSSELGLPAYFHSGSSEYNDRIASGAETKASLDARIAAARLNVYGVSFSDDHDASIRNYNALISDCHISQCSMGVGIGRTTNVTIVNSFVFTTGAVTKYFHGLYLSTIDNLLVDNLYAHDNIGIGLKVTDFYNTETETNLVIQNCKFDYNGAGTKIYNLNNLHVQNNEASHNVNSGIEVLTCKTSSVTNNTSLNNQHIDASTYDIKLQSDSNMTVSGNVYGTKYGF